MLSILANFPTFGIYWFNHQIPGKDLNEQNGMLFYLIERIKKRRKDSRKNFIRNDTIRGKQRKSGVCFGAVEYKLLWF